MKNLIVILILSLAYNLNAQTQWSWQMPQPNGNELRCIKFYNQQTGYISGQSGTILKTTTGGTNWVSLNTNAVFLINSIHVFDSVNVIGSCDSGKIIRTTNGGVNWTISNSSTANTLFSITFVNRDTGYACGANGIIIKSTDGGSSWFNLSSSTGARLNVISFANKNIGFAGGIEIMLKTTNGGVNWFNANVNFTPFDMIWSMHILDSNNIYASMLSVPALIVYSSNGGSDWVYYNPQLPNVFSAVDQPLGISFINTQTGYISTSYGKLCKTINGGQNWSQDSTFTFKYQRVGTLTSIFVSQNIIYAGGGGGTIVKSTNSGNNYFLQTGWKNALKDIYFINQDLGFSVGAYSELYKTTNAGNNWIQKPLSTTKNLNSVFFLNSQTGYIAGDTGLLLKSTNSGENWVSLSSGVTNILNDIYFLNNATGYACGRIGRIIKTTDEGNSWVNVPTSITESINKVYFKNNDTGFGFIEDKVIKTTNGGVNWVQQNLVSSSDYSFINENTGYVVGGGGLVHKTTNGGINWAQVFSRSGWVFFGVHFENEMNGMAVGSAGFYGLTAKTTNGGLNWTQMFVTNNTLNSIDFINGQTGYITGDWGNIIKTTNGGLTFINENHNEIISEYELKQNYPNPFNPVTKIVFAVPSNVKSQMSNVNISIYDITGKLIETLINKSLNSGSYEIIWDASSLPSGVYFYTLKTEEFSQTKKMLLIK